MPELSRITRQKPIEVSIDLGEGDSLTMAFDANKVTPRWMDGTMRRLEEQDTLSVCEALAEVLINWDVTQNGQPYPPSRDNIALFSFPVVTALFEEVCRSAAPSDAEGNASSPSASEPSSASEQTPESFPNGSATPTSQPVSESAPSR